MLFAASLASAAGSEPAAAKSRPAPGLRTVFLPSANNPLISLRLFFAAGAADDPPGKEGLASLTASMVGEAGTKQRTWSQVLDALYPMAASIRTMGDKDGFVFEGTVHRDNLAAFTDLLLQQILEPRFATEDFTRHRQNARDYLTKTLRGNDDEELGKQAFAATLYGQHPYGHPTAGTVSTLDALSIDDVRAFYQTHYTQDRLIVGIAGGYPTDFAEPFVAKLKALPATSPPRKALPAAPHAAGMQVVFVEKDARANAISLGHPLPITRADPDFYPLTVARSYLGEHRTFNGVLMNEMRGKRGLNYGDYAYVENFIQEGWTTFPLSNVPRRQQHFEIWIRPVAPANTLFALRQAIWETQKLIKDGIPQEGLDETKAFLANYCNLWAQDTSQRLGYAIDALIYGKDIIEELKRRLPTITKHDVDRAIRKYLHPNALTVAVVTADAKTYADALVAGTPTPITYDTKDTPAEVLAKDKLIESLRLPVDGKRVRVVSVSELFERP